MNTKFLAVLLGFGLALFGCGDDSSSSTNIDNPGGTGGAGGAGGGGVVGGAGGVGGAPITADLCEFENCGGDPSGVWNFQRSCLQPETPENPFEDTCPTASLNIETSISGTATFGDDGRYELNLMIGGTSILSMPADCLRAELTCETLESALAMGDPDDPDSGPVDVSCEQDTEEGPCVCSLNLATTTETEIGSYSVNISQITFTPDDDQPDANPQTLDFCVNSDNLTVRTPETEDDPENILVLSR